MRRLIAVVLVAFFGFPPLAASPETFAIKPRAIVYPFTSTGSSVDREASSRLATIIATRMAETGLVTVVPPPPGTERKDFLSVARAQNADYYVAGFISPLGNGVSLVEQLVSSATGIVIFSQSTQLNSYQEAATQGDDLAQYIAHHANRAFSSIGTPPPQASPTPAPSSGPEANLGKLFGRRKKAAATPSPAPKPVAVASEPAARLVNVSTPAPARPAAAPTPSPKPVAVVPAAAASERFAVTAVEGTADAALRERAAERLVSRTSAERAPSAAAACKAQPVRAVLSGVLAVRPDPQFGGASATFELDAVDCSGKVLWRQSFTRDAGGAQGMQIATERAVDAAIGAYLNPPHRR